MQVGFSCDGLPRNSCQVTRGATKAVSIDIESTPHLSSSSALRLSDSDVQTCLDPLSCLTCGTACSFLPRNGHSKSTDGQSSVSKLQSLFNCNHRKRLEGHYGFHETRSSPNFGEGLCKSNLGDNTLPILSNWPAICSHSSGILSARNKSVSIISKSSESQNGISPLASCHQPSRLHSSLSESPLTYSISRSRDKLIRNIQNHSNESSSLRNPFDTSRSEVLNGSAGFYFEGSQSSTSSQNYPKCSVPSFPTDPLKLSSWNHISLRRRSRPASPSQELFIPAGSVGDYKEKILRTVPTIGPSLTSITRRKIRYNSYPFPDGGKFLPSPNDCNAEDRSTVTYEAFDSSVNKRRVKLLVSADSELTKASIPLVCKPRRVRTIASGRDTSRDVRMLSDQESPICDACTQCDDICPNEDCSVCFPKRNKFQSSKVASVSTFCKKEVHFSECHQAQSRSAKTYKNSAECYTPCQISRHNRIDDCWVTAHGIVYNATQFLEYHPAGPECILRKAGTDVTIDYDFHSRESHKYWKQLKVGVVLRCPGWKGKEFVNYGTFNAMIDKVRSMTTCTVT